MKPTLLCLCLLALTGAGCLNGKGEHGSITRPPVAELAEGPPPVKETEVSEATLGPCLRKLENEIAFDERPQPVPAAPAKAKP